MIDHKEYIKRKEQMYRNALNEERTIQQNYKELKEIQQRDIIERLKAEQQLKEQIEKELPKLLEDVLSDLLADLQ